MRHFQRAIHTGRGILPDFISRSVLQERNEPLRRSVDPSDLVLQCCVLLVWRLSPDTNPNYSFLQVIPFQNMVAWNRKMRRGVPIPTLCGCDRLCWICGVLRRCERWNGWSGCCTVEVQVAPPYRGLRPKPACGYRATCGNKYRQPSTTPFLQGSSQCLVENIN